MHRVPLALIALAAAPLALSLPASAQSVKLQFGTPLGSFTATPSGHAKPSTYKSERPVTATAHHAERRKPVVAAAPVKPKSTVRDDAAEAPASTPVVATLEPQKVETKTEANAPTAIASGQNGNCRKFIATAGTTIEVPCTSGAE